ncbi:hypothetical protein F4809DRAFT_664190 [Biscogniauxia mediterranea]|nr:hypothetical protein F4809DRAFT_664190 [Biscogniauxia mediterranea]
MAVSPMATSRATSLLTTRVHQDTVDPTILDVEDSDDDMLVRNTGKPNIGALESIKTKLIRRLSHKSEAKRFSQQSLGNSDEEIARRAELKRLMRKRIQDELKSEEQDGRARSRCPDEPVYDNCLEPNLPGGGPRDTLEFAVSRVEKSDTGDVDNLSADTIPLAFPADKSPGKHLHRPRSCPGPAYISRDNSGLDGQLSMREAGSLPQLPSSPHLAPVHLSTTQETDSIRSWSLSYSASHLASYFGPAEEDKRSLSSPGYEEYRQDKGHGQTSDSEIHQSQETGEKSSAKKTSEDSLTNPYKNHESLSTQASQIQGRDENDSGIREESDKSLHDSSDDRYSPLDIWLCSQGLESNSAMSSRQTSSRALDRIVENKSQVTLQAAHHSPEVIVPLGLHPSRSTEHDKEVPNLPPGAWPQSRNISPNTEPDLPETPSNESLALRKVVAQVNRVLAPNLLTPEPIEHESLSRYTSSRYTTRANSRQPTPKESRLSLTEVFGGRKIVTPFLHFHRLATSNMPKDIERSDSSSYKTAPNKAPTPDSGIIHEPSPKRPTADTISITLSDTASFRQREAELRSIEKRFGLASLHRAPSFPVSSKFREEFDQARNSARGRHSFLTRLHFSIPKRESISPRQHHKHCEDMLHSRHHIPKPHITESATGLWQRAIKSEADNRRIEHENGRFGLQKQSPNTRTIGEAKQGPCVEDDQVKKHSSRYNSRSKESTHASTQKSEEGRNHGQKRPEHVDNGGLREWVNRIDAGDSLFQPELNTYGQTRIPRKLLTPPASWAKWPSHSRHERTGAAGIEDRVTSRDFANLQVSKGRAVPQSAEMNPAVTKKRNLTPIPRTLSSHFSKAMKEGWSKMVTSKDSFNRDATTSRITPDGRKSRGYLEYPELELLPTPSGYREVQALEQQIDTIKRRSVSHFSRWQDSSHDSTKPSLTARVVEQAHELQHSTEGRQSPNVENPSLYTADRLPPTQLHTLPTPRAVTGATEEFGTPQSHISYEDCVPTHMLDEDDDNSGTGDVANTMKHVRSENGLNRLETEQTQMGEEKNDTASTDH